MQSYGYKKLNLNMSKGRRMENTLWEKRARFFKSPTNPLQTWKKNFKLQKLSLKLQNYVSTFWFLFKNNKEFSVYRLQNLCRNPFIVFLIHFLQGLACWNKGRHTSFWMIAKYIWWCSSVPLQLFSSFCATVSMVTLKVQIPKA